MLTHGPSCAQVIEHTIRAALEIDWPADKLTVLLLDDGGSPGAFFAFLSLCLPGSA